MDIDVNSAAREELKKIKGVGDKTADKIMKFREEGGTMDTLEEFQKVARVRSDYLEDINKDLVFGSQSESSGNGGDLAIDDKFLDPGIIDIPFDPPTIKKPYSFTINIANVGEEADPNLFAGYKLIVGYKVSSLSPVSFSRSSKSHSQSYNIGSDGKVDVSLQTYLGSFIIQETFDILINSPEGDTIYEKSFDIGIDETVDIHVSDFTDNKFVVDLEKHETISYEGYTLRVDSRLNRDSGGIETKRNEYNIATRDEVTVDLGPFGAPMDVEAKVLSANGMIIAKKKQEWDEFSDAEGLRTLDIELPEPKNLDYDAVLALDPAQQNNPYLDHTLTISYDLFDSETEEPVRKVEETYPINADRTAHIDFEYYGEVKKMEARVKAPSGEVIGKRSYEPSDIGEDGEILIHVPPRDLADVEGIETLPERPKKTVGRVIDAMGERSYEGVQVIIYATQEESPDEEDYVPLEVVETESQGYFRIDTPKGYYKDAFARVGVSERDETDREPQDVPIRLETDEVIVYSDDEPQAEEHLFFPSDMILVVGEGAEEVGEDCECKEDDCYLDFEESKRVVEEFSYHTVVRTTEPDIQGYELEGDEEEMTVQEIVDTVSVSQGKNGEQEADIPPHFLQKSIRKNVLLKHINNKKGLTYTNLKKAINESDAKKLKDKVKSKKDVRAKGRHALDLENAVDWDEDPTIYQATSIAHGHLLQFKQEWINDGYSIGDLLYSLPLAPGQKKQIVTFDWERRESASRTGTREYEESLYNSLSRDRDVNEISKGVLKESMRGGSTAKTSAFGAGVGIGGIAGPVGGLLGVAGGSSKSSSRAWQNSSRKTSMKSMQKLRDRTVQSANAVRSQRSTVVTTATQGERFSAETETVANYNHCHSITMQYFEVLRHLKVRQRLASVQECLFVPFIISQFDHQKILRWREALAPYIYDDELEKGFDAIERIENDYEGSNLPDERYADENINYLEGEIRLEFRISPPHQLTSIENNQSKIENKLNDLFGWIPGISEAIEDIVRAEVERRNELFFENIAPKLASAFTENIKIQAVLESGQDGSETIRELPIDTTLVSRFRNNVELYVSLRQEGDMPPIKRSQIKSIAIKKASSITLNNGKFLSDVMPQNSDILIKSGRMRYRTDHISGELFDKSRIMDDLVGYSAFHDPDAGDEDDPIVVFPEGYGEDKVRIATPLSQREMRNPRDKDLELANKLVGHLNDNLEQYHRTIWMNMSDERRFMLLDGIRVTDYSEPEKYPEGIVRSVASVVENRVIGIVGNSLVMPVAPGFHLDPNIKGKDVDLLSLYEPQSPEPPAHVAIPTNGVYAESVMGECNSCEKIQDDRFWRWSEEPIPQDPTSIEEVSTASRRSEPMDTSPKDFPQPMVNIQNAPEAPDPSGMEAAARMLREGNFENITGLSQNQKNAMRALQSSLDTAKFFGSQAASLSKLGKKLQAIKNAKQNNMLSDEKAQELTEKTIQSENVSPDNLESGLANIGKVQEMVKNGEIPKDVGQRLTKAIGDGMGKSLGDSSQNLEDLIKSGSDKISEGTVESVEAETQSPDGSSSKISLSGNNKQLRYADSDLGIWQHRANKWEKWRTDIVDIALREEEAWTKESDGSKKQEGTQLDKLKEYYRATGLNPNQPASENVINNVVPEDEQNSPHRTYPELASENYIPWSAAFVSYVVKQAGVTRSDGFQFSPRHMRYIVQALVNKLNTDYNKPFWLHNVGEIEPKPGDIICKNRGESWTYGGLIQNKVTKNDQGIYEVSDDSGVSHGDIVVENYSKNGNRYIETIGGNTRDLGSNGEYDIAHTVGRKIWRLPPENTSGNIVMVNKNYTDASEDRFDLEEDYVFAIVRIPKLSLALAGSSDQAIA